MADSDPLRRCVYSVTSGRCYPPSGKVASHFLKAIRRMKDNSFKTNPDLSYDFFASKKDHHLGARTRWLLMRVDLERSAQQGGHAKRGEIF
jgi:hypothetical protein